MAYARIPIVKWEEEDGTLYVYGKASTPEIDTDEQIVAQSFSGAALKSWLDTAPAVRVQHNPQRDPAGSGVKVEINRDGDGAHWVKSAVDEPVAQRLVKKGHLRAYSIGIAKPVIERDVTGKARGGIIKGGQIMEVSLVDSPANRSCFLEIAKAASDGSAEFTGKVIGGDDMLTKTAAVEDEPITGTVMFSPGDLAKLLKMRADLEKAAEHPRDGGGDGEDEPEPDDEDDSDSNSDEDDAGKDGGDCGKTAEPETAKREFSQDRREDLADAGHALPDGSYPIPDADALRRAAVLARSGHGDVAAARRLITRRAGELGVPNPLDEDDKVKKSASEGDCATCDGSGKIMEGNRDCPDCGPGDDTAKTAEPEDGEGEEAEGAVPRLQGQGQGVVQVLPGLRRQDGPPRHGQGVQAHPG